MLAVAALLAGLGAAWLQSRGLKKEPQVAWLLGNVAVDVDGVVLDRRQLVGLGWRLAGQRDKSLSWLHFGVGEAPEVTAPVLLPADAPTRGLEVTCRFALAAGVTVSSRTRVAVPAPQTGVVPLDLDNCGRVARGSSTPVPPSDAP